MKHLGVPGWTILFLREYIILNNPIIHRVNHIDGSKISSVHKDKICSYSSEICTLPLVRDHISILVCPDIHQ
jgi:hypothetical protein